MSIEGPLGDFANAALGKMIEVERAEAAYVVALGGRLEKLIGATVVAHPVLRHPAFNMAFSLDAEGQDIDAFIRQVEAVFARDNLPHQFVVTPISLPHQFGAILEERGYRVASHRMWMELMLPPPSQPPDPRIEVATEADPATWARTVAEGFEAPSAAGLLTDLARATTRSRTHRLVFARYSGEPAGACEMTIDDGICFLRRVAVLRPFRKREIARAILHTACEAAYELDAFRILVRVFQGAGSESLFESFGFGGMQISDEYVRQFPAFLLD